MRPLLVALSLSIATAATAADGADLWRWKLRPGQTHAFVYRASTDLTTKLSLGMTGEIRDRISLEVGFDLRVDRALPDGNFEVTIPVTKLVVTSASGASTTLAELPPSVRTLRARMTPRGQFTFTERVVVEVVEGSVLAVARVTEGADGAVTSEAGASAGGVTVSARATVDPRTGRVTLQGGATEQAPATRKVEEERPVQHVDVLPVAILELLELPEGAVVPGQSLRIASPVGTIAVDAGPPKPCGAATCGALRMVLAADTAPMTRAAIAPAATPAPAAPADEGDFGSMFAEMDAMMAEASAMTGPGGDLAPSPDEAAMIAATPTMKVDFDVTALFDRAAGRLASVEGRGGSSTSTFGMSMTETTTFALTWTGVR